MVGLRPAVELAVFSTSSRADGHHWSPCVGFWQHSDKNTEATLKCCVCWIDTSRLSSVMLSSLYSSIHLPEVERNPPKMMCGCPFGTVVINSHAHIQIFSPSAMHLSVYSRIYRWPLEYSAEKYYNNKNSSSWNVFSLLLELVKNQHGCQCGIAVRSTRTHCLITWWCAFVDVQLHILTDPQCSAR